MKVIRCLLPLFCTLLAPVAFGQAVAVKRIDKHHMELTLTTQRMLGVGAAQAMLLPRIEQECGNLKPTFGRYHFEGRTPVDQSITSKAATSFSFVQEITCGQTSAAPASEASIGIVRTSSSNDLKEFIRNISLQFLTKRSNGALGPAYDALSGQMRAFSPVEEWSKQARQFNKLSGPIKSATVWRVTVYENPANAPMLGTYIAADYEVRYQHVPLQCGYLMWYELPHHRFVILREESGTISSQSFNTLSADELSQVKARLGCAR